MPIDNEAKARHDAKVERIAFVAHEVNRAYCAAIGEKQPGWDGAPDWQRESARNGVEFHLKNPNAGPAASHANWLKEKIADGWQYGEAKDEALKLHPCVVPFSGLPQKQQAKDYLFQAVVHAVNGLGVV